MLPLAGWLTGWLAGWLAWLGGTGGRKMYLTFCVALTTLAARGGVRFAERTLVYRRAR